MTVGGNGATGKGTRRVSVQGTTGVRRVPEVTGNGERLVEEEAENVTPVLGGSKFIGTHMGREIRRQITLPLTMLRGAEY